MKQIIEFVPFQNCEHVPEEQLLEFVFNKRNIRGATHLGQRKGRKGKLSFLELFMEKNPITKWKATVEQAGKISMIKARKKINDTADF